MWRAAAEVARAVSGLRRVELARRRAARPSDGAGRGESPLRPGLGWSGGETLQRHPDIRCAANFVGRRGVRSRAWWRHRAGRSRAARRRAGHRQVHAAAPGGGARGADNRSGALQFGRGIRTSNQASRRAPLGRSLAPLSARRNMPRENSRGDRAAQAVARHRRFDSDDIFRAVSIGSRQHRPGARGGDSPVVCRKGPQCPDRARRAT